MSCYTFETRNYTNGMFNVDATYIIHLENNGRYQKIENQLSQFIPSNKVYILRNKGYDCKQNINIKNSTDDLVDAYLTILNDAKLKNYENILILEDDFIFDERVNNQNHKDNVNKFLKTHNADYIFILGCIPFIQIPYNSTTYKGFSGGTHSIIYSKSVMDKIIKDTNKITDWDYYIKTKYAWDNYIYYTPLCYQLFSNTDNSRNWGINNPLLYIISFLFKIIIKIVRLDKSIEPGYSIFYILSKLLFIVFIYLIYKFYKSYVE
uniref:Glycosyltransferase n=1 Tax=viral metagenome TaxID=1070528 RepID=A0A6C0JMZ9_9ZZZZ